MEQLMTLEEVADYLRVTERTVYRLLWQRSIPAKKVGRQWRFEKNSLDKWLNQGPAGRFNDEISSQGYDTKNTVLVVDDDKRVRDILQDIITNQGYQVTAVGSGEEAIEKIGEQHFDLVFLDLMLPGINGVDTLKHLKESGKNLAVVLVTAYSDYPIAFEAMSMGPIFMMKKPFSVDDVIQALSVLVKE